MPTCRPWSYGCGRFFDPFGRPRPRLPNPLIVLAPSVTVLRGFHHSTILDSWSPALAGRSRRRAWIALGPLSSTVNPFVLFFGSGTVARVVPVAWRFASELSTVGALRLVLVASGRPWDLDD